MMGIASLNPSYALRLNADARDAAVDRLTRLRTGRHWNKAVMRRKIYRPIFWDRVHPLDDGFVDERVFRNRARLGIRDVMPKKGLPRFPFLVFVRFREVFEQAPGERHRIVRVAQKIGSDVAERTAFPRHAPGQMIDGPPIDGKTAFLGLIDHP